MVVISVVSLLVLGLVCSIILAAASRAFHVQEDPRVEAIADILPGANCGGCGFAGCSAYAAAVINDVTVPANRCCVGGSATADKVAELSGKVAASNEPMRSFRRCSRPEGNVKHSYHYEGFKSCHAVSLLEEGHDACRFSCVGFGDCVRACPFEAMHIEDGVVHINEDKCTNCGICVQTCPRHVLELVPRRARVMVVCASRDKLKDVMAVCEAGCISCLKCAKKCPAGAVSLKEGRVHIDHAKCIEYGAECNEACIEACSRHIMRPIGATALLPKYTEVVKAEPEAKPAEAPKAEAAPKAPAAAPVAEAPKAEAPKADA